MIFSFSLFTSTQSIAALLGAHLVVSPMAETVKPLDKWTDPSNIFDRLQWRYKTPEIDASVSVTSADDHGEPPAAQPEISISRSPNPIDRAWWPAAFVYIRIPGVLYTEDPGSTRLINPLTTIELPGDAEDNESEDGDALALALGLPAPVRTIRRRAAITFAGLGIAPTA